MKILLAVHFGFDMNDWYSEDAAYDRSNGSKMREREREREMQRSQG
jgi:hypothetical protein